MSQQSLSQPSENSAASATSQPKSKEGTGRFVQEKIMLGMGLVFFGGVLVLTVVPEPFSGVAMGLTIFLTVWVMFGFK